MERTCSTDFIQNTKHEIIERHRVATVKLSTNLSISTLFYDFVVFHIALYRPKF